MKRKIEIIALVSLVLISAILLRRNQAGTHPAVAKPSTSSTLRADLAPELPPDETIHWGELHHAQQVVYLPHVTAGGASPREHRKEPDPLVVPNPQPIAIQPPKLPVSFFGYGTVPAGSARRAFLTDGYEVYILIEGETLFSRFRILRINDASLDFEDLATGRKSVAPLEEGLAPGSSTAA